MKLLTFFILLSFFISSCGTPNPETILGIKLGRPVQEQKKLIAGLLYKQQYENPYWQYKEEWEYTVLSDSEHFLESYVTIFDCKDKDGNEIVTSVLTAIINPRFHHPEEENPRYRTTPWLQYINEQDAQWLLKIFQDKYGKTEVKQGAQVGYSLVWHKNNLDIKMSILASTYYGGEYYYRAQIRYEFPDDILKTVCQHTKPVEKF